MIKGMEVWFSDEEMAPMLDYLLDNWYSAWQELGDIREFIIRRNGWETFRNSMRGVYDWIKEQPESDAFRVFRETTLEFIKREDKVMLSRLLGAAKAYRTSKPTDLATRSMYQCYSAIRDLDTLDSADPQFTLNPKH